ncbi:protein phosphatase 2C domain-containing protein [Mesorhizobium sp. A623]
MGFEVDWHSQQGTRTPDNRDYAGVGTRADTALFIILDGSTSTPTSGELVREITRDIVNWYVTSAAEITVETLTAQLRRTHESLSKIFPSDSASYGIAHLDTSGRALVLHAGDCLFGCYDEKGPIQWLTQPHTLANALGEVPVDEIINVSARHRLTRSFRSREFIMPDVAEIELADNSLVAATDGFWAELNLAEQWEFVDRRYQPTRSERDDRSVLLIRHLDDGRTDRLSQRRGASENVYFRSTVKEQIDNPSR